MTAIFYDNKEQPWPKRAVDFFVAAGRQVVDSVMNPYPYETGHTYPPSPEVETERNFSCPALADHRNFMGTVVRAYLEANEEPPDGQA